MNSSVPYPTRSDMLVLTALLRIPRKVLQFETKLKQPWKPCQVEVGQGWITVRDSKNKLVCKDQLFRLNCQTFESKIVIQAQNIRFKLKPYSGSEKQFTIFKNIIESRWDSVDAGTGSVFSSLVDSKEIKPIQGFRNNINTLSPSNQITNEKLPKEPQSWEDTTRVQPRVGADTTRVQPRVGEDTTRVQPRVGEDTARVQPRVGEDTTRVQPRVGVDTSPSPTRVLIHEKTIQTKKVGVSSFQVSPKKLKGGSSGSLHKYTFSAEDGLNDAVILIHEQNNNVKPQIKSIHYNGLPQPEQNKNCDNISGKENIEIGGVDLVRKPYFKSLNEIKTSMSTPTFQDKCKDELGIDAKNIESGFNSIEKTIDNEINDGNGIENSVNVIDRTIFNEVDKIGKISNIIEKTTTKIDRRNSVSVISSISKKKLSDQFEKAMKNFDDQINLFKSLSLTNRQSVIEKKDSNNNKDEGEEKDEHRSRSATRRSNSDRIRRLSREKSREKIKNRTILDSDENSVLKIYFN